jgi:hypothetical protein
MAVKSHLIEYVTSVEKIWSTDVIAPEVGFLLVKRRTETQIVVLSGNIYNREGKCNEILRLAQFETWGIRNNKQHTNSLVFSP